MAPCYGSAEIVRLSKPFNFTFINSVPDHAAGAGKSILWCAVSQLLLCQKIHILDELRYY